MTEHGTACLARSRARPGGPWASPGSKSAVYAAITKAEWCDIYDSQGGCCACCLKKLRDRWRDPGGSGELASVDHDHDVETALRKAGADVRAALRRSIRGLLCAYPCNKMWPRYFNAERLQRLAIYAHLSPAQRFIADTPDLP